MWRVSLDGRGLTLRSVLHDVVWTPGHELTAACEDGHDAPEEGCSCGIYAVPDERAALRYLVGRNDPEDVHRVIGRVALWGWVLEAAAGWRASHAYPACIWIPARLPSGFAPPLRAIEGELGKYGVPLERF